MDDHMDRYYGSILKQDSDSGLLPVYLDLSEVTLRGWQGRVADYPSDELENRRRGWVF